MARRISAAITDDIGENLEGPGVAETVMQAVDFSRTLNDRFSRGTIGRLLNIDVAGGRAIPER